MKTSDLLDIPNEMYSAGEGEGSGSEVEGGGGGGEKEKGLPCNGLLSYAEEVVA